VARANRPLMGEMTATPQRETWATCCAGCAARPDRQRGGSLRSGGDCPGASRPSSSRSHPPMCSQAAVRPKTCRRAAPLARARSSEKAPAPGKQPTPAQRQQPTCSDRPRSKVRGQFPPWLRHDISKKAAPPPASMDDLGGVGRKSTRSWRLSRGRATRPAHAQEEL